MNKVIGQTSVLALLVIFAGLAHAQSPRIEGVPIKIGDSVEMVKKAYATTIEPEANQVGTRIDGTKLYLRSKGVLVVFDRQGTVRTIRLEAPFSGNIGGVKIGHRRTEVEKLLGSPGKKMHPPKVQMESYDYFFDDSATTRFLFNDDDTVDAMIMFK